MAYLVSTVRTDPKAAKTARITNSKPSALATRTYSPGFPFASGYAKTITRPQPTLCPIQIGTGGGGGGVSVPTTGQIWPRGSKAGIEV